MGPWEEKSSAPHLVPSKESKVQTQAFPLRLPGLSGASASSIC